MTAASWFIRGKTGGHRPPLQIFLIVACVFLSACDEFRPVSHSGAGAYEATMTPVPNGFAVAWYDDRDGNPEIYFRLLDSQGRPQGAEHRLTNDPEFSYEADLAWANGNLAVGWYERSMNGSLRAKLGVWTLSGEPRWTKTVSSAARDGRNIVIRANKNELFSAWIEDLGGDDAELWGQWWSLEGQPLTAPARLASASRTTWNVNAGIDGQGRALLVFDTKAGSRTDELFLLRTDKSKAELFRLSADDGFSSKYPDLALSEDRAAITWFDKRDGNEEVYLAVAASTDLHEGVEPAARRITNTRGESIGAYVTWNGNRVGLAWCDNTEGQHEVYFRDFDSHGMPLQEARRLTHTRTQSLIPTIRPALNAFALVWNEYMPRGPGHTLGGRSEVMFTLTP